jgi:hypothetical protein
MYEDHDFPPNTFKFKNAWTYTSSLPQNLIAGTGTILLYLTSTNWPPVFEFSNGIL